MASVQKSELKQAFSIMEKGKFSRRVEKVYPPHSRHSGDSGEAEYIIREPSKLTGEHPDYRHFIDENDLPHVLKKLKKSVKGAELNVHKADIALLTRALSSEEAGLLKKLRRAEIALSGPRSSNDHFTEDFIDQFHKRMPDLQAEFAAAVDPEDCWIGWHSLRNGYTLNDMDLLYPEHVSEDMQGFISNDLTDAIEFQTKDMQAVLVTARIHPDPEMTLKL